MKKTFALIISIIICLTFIGCSNIGNNSDNSSSKSLNSTAEVNSQNSSDNQSSEPANDSSDFDLENGTVKLNSGYEMPILGIGTYRLSDSEAENSVYWHCVTATV